MVAFFCLPGKAGSPSAWKKVEMPRLKGNQSEFQGRFW